MIILAPTLETLLGINEGMRRERMGKKGRKRRPKPGISQPEKYIFPLKLKTQINFTETLKSEMNGRFDW